MPIAPTICPTPTPLKGIAAAMARDTLVAQAEIAGWLSFPLAGYRRAEFCCSSEKLAREAEQLELVLEMVEADQFATASPTVAAAGVEDLVDWNSVRFSAICFCQIDPLSRPKDDPLSGLDIP